MFVNPKILTVRPSGLVCLMCIAVSILLLFRLPMQVQV